MPVHNFFNAFLIHGLVLGFDDDALTVIEADVITIHDGSTQDELIAKDSELNAKAFQIANINITNIHRGRDDSRVS